MLGVVWDESPLLYVRPGDERAETPTGILRLPPIRLMGVLGLDILAGEGGAEPSRELPVDVFLLRVPSLRWDLGGRGLVKEEVTEECG